MRKIHYNPDSGEILATYDGKWDGEPLTPFVELTEEDASGIFTDNHNHIDIETGTTSARHFDLPEGEFELFRRAWRDRRLNSTDKYLTVPDFPITESQKEELLNYREKLRDYPETWVKPKVPSFLPYNS